MVSRPPPDVLGETQLAGGRASVHGETTLPNARDSGSFADPAVPEQVGRFRLEDRLGAGGMGVVYRARDPDLDRGVAVKLLHPRFTSDAHGQRRLLREARALARLQHPNVVTVYEAGTVGDRMWIAMELVPGVTLAAWLRSERPAWTAALDVMLAAGRGLAAAHAAGLVHSDIKPENIMIDDEGRVRVMDFGLVRAHSDGVVGGDPARGAAAELVASAGSVLAGTPRYMAPELYNFAAADARSDQYAWCVTCWEAVYGQTPFPQESLASLATAISAGRIAPPPDDRSVPEWLQNVLERGLHVDPRRRFGSMRELFAEISANRPTFAGLLATKNAAALRIEALLGLTLVPAFWILDWYIMTPWVWVTLPLRLTCAAYAAVILGLSAWSRRWFVKRVVALGFSFSLLVVWSIAAMCFFSGGYESPYYAGMNLLFLIVGQVFWWDLRTSLAFAGAAYGLYMAPLLLGLVPIREPALALSNQFFLLSTLLVTIVSQAHRLGRLRREFVERALHERLLAEARALQVRPTSA